mmetsp:Transcript_21873/g.65456  ORF Transcript_21873/g.65456 Transcript_21873/m.65456 type:complete len:211 (+) Transcript_21873:886-1518(+)
MPLPPPQPLPHPPPTLWPSSRAPAASVWLPTVPSSHLPARTSAAAQRPHRQPAHLSPSPALLLSLPASSQPPAAPPPPPPLPLLCSPPPPPPALRPPSSAGRSCSKRRPSPRTPLFASSPSCCATDTSVMQQNTVSVPWKSALVRCGRWTQSSTARGWRSNASAIAWMQSQLMPRRLIQRTLDHAGRSRFRNGGRSALVIGLWTLTFSAQ